MAGAHLLNRDYSVSLGRDRSSAIELWHVADIEGWDASNTTGTVFAKIPYTIGQSYPDAGIGEATCRTMALRQRWTDGRLATGGVPYWQALVAVIFDSANRESVFNPRSRVSRTRSEYVRVPCWSVTDGAWFQTTFPVRRAVTVRVLTRHARTAQVTEAAENNIHLQTNRVFHFDQTGGPIFQPNPSAIPYLFIGANLSNLSNGLTRIEYVFETTGIVRPFTAGALGGMVQRDVPGLGPLDEYTYRGDGLATAPDVVVTTWEDKYLAGTTLPFL